MAQDYYEVLQVHPRADQAAIQAAYERLASQYDPSRLSGVADELIDIARRKRDQIDAAYAVLSSAERRAAYDSQFSDSAPAPVADAERPAQGALDYRPLPPAGRQERSRRFNAEPEMVYRRGAMRLLGLPTPVVVGMLVVLGILVTSVLIAGGLNQKQSGTPSADAQPTATLSPLDSYEAVIAQAKTSAEQNPSDPKAWITYGNYLYDSVQIVRENAPASTLYQQRLPRWLEASQAYERALALDPSNASVLADKGVSQCYYGAGAGEQSFVEKGLVDVRNAAAALPNDAMVQLNLGDCLMSTVPPQTDAALGSWKRVLELEPADSEIAKRAQELIQANTK